jgi:hypothetical protein
MRPFLLSLLLVVTLLSSLALAWPATGDLPKAPALLVPAAAEAPAVARDGQSDFDFFVGTWKLKNRRLTKPLVGATTWYEFDCTSRASHLLGGKASMDDLVCDTEKGKVEGLTLRLYDPKSRQWRLYWVNVKNPILDVPVIGEFKDGVGEFFDQELYEGRSIFVRYRWSNIKPRSYTWEQAFSTDGGKTWETNWVTQGSRID